MLKKIIILLSVFFLPFAGQGLIIETPHVADVIPLIDDDTWFLVDLENTLFTSQRVNRTTTIKPLEEDFVPSLLLLQDRSIVVMGLTQRRPSIANITLKQVESLGFDFKATAPSEKTFIVPTLHSCLYKQGILFVSEFNQKGKAFIKFLSLIEKSPKKVVFIDDKHKNVEEVEKALANSGIDYIGVHYTAKEYLKTVCLPFLILNGKAL